MLNPLPFIRRHIMNTTTGGYNQGRIISLIVFTEKPLVVMWTGLAAYEKGIFYGAVLARGRHLFFIELNMGLARSRWKHFLFLRKWWWMKKLTIQPKNLLRYRGVCRRWRVHGRWAWRNRLLCFRNARYRRRILRRSHPGFLWWGIRNRHHFRDTHRWCGSDGNNLRSPLVYCNVSKEWMIHGVSWFTP